MLGALNLRELIFNTAWHFYTFTTPTLFKVSVKTIMTTFIKVKLKKSDDETNIDKYTEYHSISILIFLKITIPNLMMTEVQTFPSV